ncbi:MAG: hypothetical protein AB7Q37_14235 [Pyrinomonadaceae bacterium]
MAQDRVPDLQGLIGMRASSGQAELEYRGFAFVKSGGVGGEGRYSYYWSGARQLCITVATVNGRFDSIVTSPPFDCGRNANQGGSSSGSVVTVYEDHDLRGRSQVFHDGRYLNNRGQLGNLRNDRASSVDVPVGYSVRLCDGEGTGYGILPCQVFGPGRHNLPYTLDNRVSYVEVSQILWGGGTGTGPGAPVPSTPGLGRPGATVYSDRNFRGRSQSYGPGRYLNTERQLGDLRNDEASSVAVLNGYRVKLCENEGAYGHGGGRCEEYGPGRYNLRYNDDVSYVEVTRSSGGSANLPGWIGSILKVNVTDLVGERVVSGDTKMRNRGFRLVDTLRSGRAYYTIWWRGVSRQCIQVAVANNRYDSVSDIGSHERCY